uniref:Uncharacterized protein n=1 Tax=Leptobrachium leishanense TaxID=445787 RepID=A0A8C5R0T3_9ANUR
MDSGEAVAFVLTTYTYLRKTKKRKWWVHPVNCERYRHGAFVTLYKPLREKDPVKFFNLLRMSIPSFDELLATVREPLMKMDTKMRTTLSPEELLVFTLRYLASGCSLQDIHYLFRIGRSTAGILIRKVCKTIWNTMKEECINLQGSQTLAPLMFLNYNSHDSTAIYCIQSILGLVGKNIWGAVSLRSLNTNTNRGNMGPYISWISRKSRFPELHWSSGWKTHPRYQATAKWIIIYELQTLFFYWSDGSS